MVEVIRKLTESDDRTLVGKILRLPLRLIPKTSVLTVRAGINKGARWIAGSSLHSCWLGTYEADKQKLIETVVRPGMTVWDVGANAGYYTVAFARLVGGSGRVFAFEPYAENADNVLGHVRLNHLNNVVLVQAAVSSDDGLVGFQPGRLNAMGRISDERAPYLIPSLTVDGFIARFPDARPDLMKIDVEGAEQHLLEGARGLLASSAPEIVLALHGEDLSRGCTRLLRSMGYAIHYLDGSEAGEPPLRSSEVYARRKIADPSPSLDTRAETK